jgi:hypothetical protein
VRERQIAELVEDDEVHASQVIGKPSLPRVAGFGLEPVDEIDHVVESAAGAGSNATSSDGDGQVGFAGAGSTDQHGVALAVAGCVLSVVALLAFVGLLATGLGLTEPRDLRQGNRCLLTDISRHNDATAGVWNGFKSDPSPSRAILLTEIGGAHSCLELNGCGTEFPKRQCSKTSQRLLPTQNVEQPVWCSSIPAANRTAFV